MGRPIRFIPENAEGVLVEVTGRVIGARAMLVPAPSPFRFNEIVVGVMGRALEVAPLELCSCSFLANHFHAHMVVQQQQVLSRFMQHLCGNLSKEVGRMRGWRGTLWEGRYNAVVVSDEPEAQWARLKYVLSQGVKEGLVESPLDWPGVHAARALACREPLQGYWFHRSKEWASRNRGQEYGRYDFATRYLVSLAQLPAFRHLSPEEYQDRVADLIREIEEENERKRDGNPVAGVEKILSQNPLEPPTRRTKRSTRPLFHAASKRVRDDLMAELAEYQSRYLVASEALRSGNMKAAEWFPEGSFPPALPFRGDPPPRRPPPPPTRSIRVLESGAVERGEIPVVAIAVVEWVNASAVVEPRARGQPP